MAPEIIQQGYPDNNASYGRSADIWSTGALLIEMATGYPPWYDLPAVTAMYKIGSTHVIPAFPGRLNNHGHLFLSQCFQRDASLRPSAGELMDHPYVKDVEFERDSPVNVKRKTSKDTSLDTVKRKSKSKESRTRSKGRKRSKKKSRNITSSDSSNITAKSSKITEKTPTEPEDIDDSVLSFLRMK
eukprot:TRINITY_DN5104_c0_g1_i2.p1 TRINITY_DN5104_c0_g1~~TRINITY_DN5104_c0_g1_i2.p1  ORF type:complete len:186 (-),score=42.57 TRINITY_DN5104_c0_g1_i2:449-1006(-)